MTLTLPYPIELPDETTITTIDVDPTDDSTVQSELMGVDSLTLVLSMPTYEEIPVGTYVDYNGTRYTLQRPPSITKVHSRNYEYTLIMYAPNYAMRLLIFRNVVIDYGNSSASPAVPPTIGGDLTIKFSLTATPKEHLQMVVDNLNRENIALNLQEPLWSIGSCLDFDRTTGVDSGTEKLISYDSLSCLDALALIADTFETEYYFDYTNHKVSLKMLEIYKSSPLDMAYGKGNGFVSGVGRTPEGELPPIGRLFVNGSDRNIDPSKYGKVADATPSMYDKERIVPSHTLLLPRRGELWYDGQEFQYTTPSPLTNWEHYVVTADRNAIVNAENCTPVSPYGSTDPHPWKEDAHLVEDSLDASDIYPQLELTIHMVHVEDHETNKVNIRVQAASDDAFFTALPNLTIGGEKPTVIFQSGQLAGRELDLQTSDDDGTIKVTYLGSTYGWELELVPEQIDGVCLPGGNPEDNYNPSTQTYTLNDAYMPAAGDKFAIFGIKMPNYYLDAYEGSGDNRTRLHQGAEWDLFRRAAEHLFIYEHEAYTFSGDADSIWAKHGWTGNGVISGGIGARMSIGNYVRLTDNIMNNLLMRITAVSRPLHNPYALTLTLNNMPIKGGYRVSRNRQRGSEIATRETTNDMNRSLNNEEGRTIARFREAKSDVNSKYATLVGLANQLVDRVNDDKTMFHSLSEAIKTFNNAQGSGNKINFEDCIINGQSQFAPQDPQQCKNIPTLDPIVLNNQNS